MYSKGMLFWYMLDKEFEERGKSFDDFVKVLYVTFDHESPGTPGELVQLAGEFVGEDLSPFFDKYLYGNVEFPLSELEQFRQSFDEVLVIDYNLLPLLTKRYYGEVAATPTATRSPTTVAAGTPTPTSTAIPSATATPTEVPQSLESLDWPIYMDAVGNCVCERYELVQHEGITICTQLREAVRAACDGTVGIVRTEDLPGSQWVVLANCATATRELIKYKYLDAVKAGISAGVAVKAGDVLGFAGVRDGVPVLEFEGYDGPAERFDPSPFLDWEGVDVCPLSSPGAVPVSTDRSG
jgi:hypothetical protein